MDLFFHHQLIMIKKLIALQPHYKYKLERYWPGGSVHMACQHGSAPNWVKWGGAQPLQRPQQHWNRVTTKWSGTRWPGRGTDPVTRSFTVHGPWRYVVRRQATLGPTVAEGPGVRTIFFETVLLSKQQILQRSQTGVNAAGIAEIVVIFRNDSSLAEMPGSFA